MKKIQLSDHFNYKTMILFSLPSIGEALFTTSFQMVDGFFASNMLGVTPFVAVNLISPIFYILYSLGLMFGTGTSAAVSKLLGSGDKHKANQVFTEAVFVMTIVGIVLGAITTIFMPQLSILAGATEEEFDYCVTYGRLLTSFLPSYFFVEAFVTLWITAGKAWIGMLVSALNGCINIFLDYLFMGPFKMGIMGAALATSISATVSAVIIIIYFARKNKSELRFVSFEIKKVRGIGQICINGLAEMLGGIAVNITAIFMNNQLVRLMGESSVAAFGVYNYVCEFFMAIFFGICSASVTVVGFKFGEKNKKELDSLVKTNSILTLVIGGAMCLLSVVLAGPISTVFVGYNEEVFALSVSVLRITSFFYLAYGFVLFISSLFAGIGKGVISTVIALCLTLIFPMVMIYLFPVAFGTNSIWWAIPVSAILCVPLCAVFLKKVYPKVM